MSFVESLEALVELPLLFTISVGLGAILVAGFLFVLPLYFALRSEPAALAKMFVSTIGKAQFDSVLLKIAASINWLTCVVGQITAWLVVAMTVMQFTVVILRYVFSWGSVQMQESIWYMHGIIFTLCAGYTLLREGHVRIDVFYAKFSSRQKAWVNIFGVVCFILPVCVVTLDIGYPYVANAWQVMEGSTEGTGLHYVYLLKTTILAFAVLMILQGISLLCSSIHTVIYEKTSAVESI